MKDQLSIIIAIAALSFVAVRLYQKYIRKDDRGKGSDSGEKKKTGSFSSAIGDDYEPYSKK